MTVATSAPTILPRSAPNRTPSPSPALQGTAARIGVRVEGCIMAGTVAVTTIREHVETFDVIDQRGDRIRARIWQHQDAALAACLRGDLNDAIAELHGARGLRGPYEEADAYEREHVAEAGAEALDGRRWLLAGRADLGALLGQKLGVDLDADIGCDLVLP